MAGPGSSGGDGGNSTAQNATQGAAGGGGGHGPGSFQPISYEIEHEFLGNFLLIVCGAVAFIVIVWRVSNVVVRYVRTVTSLGNDTQKYYAAPSWKLSMFKKHVLYAPVSRKRHNREIQMSSAVNMGTLPTRLQLVFIVGYLATNVAFCLRGIALHENFATAASQFRNRTGVLAVVNMVRWPRSGTETRGSC